MRIWSGIGSIVRDICGAMSSSKLLRQMRIRNNETYDLYDGELHHHLLIVYRDGAIRVEDKPVRYGIGLRLKCDGKINDIIYMPESNATDRQTAISQLASMAITNTCICIPLSDYTKVTLLAQTVEQPRQDEYTEIGLYEIRPI